MKRKKQPHRKKFKFVKNIFSKNDFIYAIICLILLGILFTVKGVVTKSFEWDNLIDLKIFSTFIVVFILNSVTKAIIERIRINKEENTKLTNDYDVLSKMYVNTPLVRHENSIYSDFKTGRKNTHCTTVSTAGDVDIYKIPVTDVVSFIGKSININDDPKKFYTLPKKIDDAMSELYQAHDFSKRYNKMIIRCDGVKQNESNEINLYFSRTTYYHSLITNRALDYKKDGISIRELCLYGPFLPPLEKSELSDHIGFNGFVETTDGYIPLIFRPKHVSIAKKTIQSSVGAPLKSEYALDSDLKLTKHGIVRAMRHELADELNLLKLEDYETRKADIFAEFDFDKILCCYRELVEGGKPQFMFFTKINITKDEIKTAFTSEAGFRKNSADKFGFYKKGDGYKLIFVEKRQLDKIYICPDGLVINNKFYKSAPSTTGPLALLIKYLKTGKIICA